MEMLSTSLISKDSRSLGYWIQESESKRITALVLEGVFD